MAKKNRPTCIVRNALVIAILALATGIIYWQVYDHDFVDFDDDVYVYENPVTRQGVSLNNLPRIATTVVSSNWHPVTLFSHALDVELFGLHAPAHIRVNIGWHILNAAILFLLLRRMTGSFWCSGFVAAMFALHPVNVESVAWISERKNVVSTFFWLLSTACYVHYARTSRRTAYAGTILFLIFGLMAKPMLVTLPFTLLLFDYWPLSRLRLFRPQWKDDLKARLKEKVPLFLVVIVFCFTTLGSQETHPIQIGFRLGNAVFSYTEYLRLLAFPSQLVCFYPHPGIHLPPVKALASLIALTCVSVWIWVERRRRPYLLAGWCWFMGTLLPVSGIVQVGGQSMADRYLYIPIIGIAIMVAWWMADLTKHGGLSRAGAAIIALSFLVFWSVAAYAQVGVWKDSYSLYLHALSCTERNYTIHGNLGSLYQKAGLLDRAEKHFREAVRIVPNYSKAQANLGAVQIAAGKLEEGRISLERAIQLDPHDAAMYNNLALLLNKQGKLTEAEAILIKALKMTPRNPAALHNLGIVLARQGKNREAIRAFAESHELRPGNFDTQFNLAILLEQAGQRKAAAENFRDILSRWPNHKASKEALERIMKGPAAP